MSPTLATGPVSWGVDFAGAPGNPPWAEVLDGIVDAGYRGLELGPLGYLPEDPARLRAELGARGLSVAGSFVFEPLHQPERLPGILAVARRTAALVAAAGGRHLVIIDLVSPARAWTAGREADAPRLDAPGRRALERAVREVAAIAAEAGLVPAVHPHAGTYVEFADEIAAVAEVAPLCLDTGHLAYAGLAADEVYGQLAERVVLLHLKDVDPQVRSRVVGRRLGYWDAVAAGIFCPVGQGCVPFAGLARRLRARGFAGWATVEQDRLPGGDPVADLIDSRRALEALGIAG